MNNTFDFYCCDIMWLLINLNEYRKIDDIGGIIYRGNHFIQY